MIRRENGTIMMENNIVLPKTNTPNKKPQRKSNISGSHEIFKGCLTKIEYTDICQDWREGLAFKSTFCFHRRKT